MEGCSGNKRSRADADEAHEAKRLHADIFFAILEDDDIGIGVGERDPASQELETVMKSLEEEIGQPPAMAEGIAEGRQMEIGYLLEASDDELGLPPQGKASVEKKEVELPEEFGHIWGLEDDGMPAWCEGFSEFGNFSENFVMAEEDIGAAVTASLDGGAFDSPEFYLRPLSLPAL